MNYKKALWVAYLSSLIVVYCGIFISIWIWGNKFNWGENAISDLGTVKQTGWIFNLSLIIGGILFALSGVILFKMEKEFPGKNLSINIFLAGFSLFIIGIFPSNSNHTIHNIFAWLYFFFLLVILANIASIYYLKNMKKLFVLDVIAMAIFIIVGSIYTYIGMATSEIISASLTVSNLLLFMYIFYNPFGKG